MAVKLFALATLALIVALFVVVALQPTMESSGAVLDAGSVESVTNTVDQVSEVAGNGLNLVLVAIAILVVLGIAVSLLGFLFHS